MSYTYRITILNSQNQMTAWRVVAATLSDAITAVKTAANTTADPTSTQIEGPINPAGAIQV